MAEKKGMVVCGIACLVCILFAILIIVLVGVGTVEPIEYGIIYNKFSKKVSVDEGVKPGGWFWIGWTNNFIFFPATQVNMDFTNPVPPAKTQNNGKYRAVKLKDSVGQDITLGFALQYKLKQAKIVDLHATYTQTYEVKWEGIIRQNVIATVGKFGNTDFWLKRQESGAELLKKIQALEQIAKYADIISLQILDVALTTQRENTLIKTQVTKQKKFTIQKEQEAKVIRSKITVTKSETQKLITEIVGKANANAKEIVAKAQVAATKQIIDATTIAYGELKTQIDVTPQNGLDEFIYYSDMQTSEDTDILINIKNAFIKVDN